VCEGLVPEGGRIARGIYECGRQFRTDLVLPYFAPPDEEGRHGVVVTTGDAAEFWLLVQRPSSEGPQTVKLERLGTVGVAAGRMNRQKCGGQSAPRFGRIREQQVAAFVKSVADACTEHFAHPTTKVPTIATLAVGGTGGAQVGVHAQVARSSLLLPGLRERMLAPAALSVATVASLIEASAKERLKSGGGEVRRLVGEFEEDVRSGKGCAVYGLEALKAAAASGQLKTFVCVSDAKEWKELAASVSGTNDKTRILVVAPQDAPLTLVQYGGALALSYFPLTI
jgi:peptide subunit release factor 1 (eRF1)